MKRYETVDYWEEQRKASEEYLDPVLKKFQLYASWYAGDMESLASAIQKAYGLNAPMGSPLLNLVTRTARAEMFYRNPRYMVEPIERFGPTIFTPALSSVETILLNDFVEETNFFHEGRRVILDMLLAHRGIFKIGYSSDIGMNYPAILESRDKALKENMVWVTEFKAPRVGKADIHTTHIEAHAQAIALAQRGDTELPPVQVERMKAHIHQHQKMLDKYSERPKENIRYEHVWCKRVSPMRFRFDPWAESPTERRWVGEIFVRDVDDVRANELYDQAARVDVGGMDINAIEGLELDSRYERLLTRGTEDNKTILVEIVDTVRRKVITYAMNSQKPLRVRDYVMADVLPDGPYVDEAFTEHPLDDCGIPQPQVYEEFQKALGVMDTILMEISKRSVPRQAIDVSALSPDELKKLRRPVPGNLIEVSGLRAGKSMKDIIQDVPLPRIDTSLMQIRQMYVRGIEQYSGLGSAKLAGGDSAKTATASAIIGESVATLTEDLNSVLDNMLSRVGKKALRMMRLMYDTPKVEEIVGQMETDNAWPTEWSVRDIIMDRGVKMVPGSTQRKNAAVEQKLMVELYSLVSQDPAIPPAVRVELLRRVFDAAGVYGLDVAGMEQKIMEQELMAQQQAQQEQQGGSDPAERTKRRTDGEGTEASRASLAQGVANVGAGRVATGASAGDGPKSPAGRARSKAKSNIKGRGGQ